MQKNLPVLWPRLHDFKKRFNILNDIFNKYLIEGRLQFNLGVRNGKVSTVQMTTPSDEIKRFIELLAPFATPGSGLFYKQLARDILEMTLLTPERRSSLEEILTNTEKPGVKLAHNGRALTGPELFHRYASSIIAATDLQLEENFLMIAPTKLSQELIRFIFFEYCLRVYEAVGEMYSLVRTWEKGGVVAVRRLAPSAVAKCIYCLSEDGPFESEEHFVPESLGNESLLLPRGVVCDECNHGLLAKLDQHLAEESAVSFLRAFYLPFNTKTGNYVKHKNKNFSISKTGPGLLELDTSRLPRRQRRSLLKNNLTLSYDTRHPADPRILFARSLFKMGLGLLAFDVGHREALHSKYNAARSFIRGESGFLGSLNLIVAKLRSLPGHAASFS